MREIKDIDGYGHAINQDRMLQISGFGGGIKKDNALSLGQGE